MFISLILLRLTLRHHLPCYSTLRSWVSSAVEHMLSMNVSLGPISSTKREKKRTFILGQKNNMTVTADFESLCISDVAIIREAKEETFNAAFLTST